MCWNFECPKPIAAIAAGGTAESVSSSPFSLEIPLVCVSIPGIEKFLIRAGYKSGEGLQVGRMRQQAAKRGGAAKESQNAKGKRQK